MTDAPPIRVYIADDFDLMRQAMRQALSRVEDIELIGEALRLEEALQEVTAVEPDVIIMNDYLPPVDSAHATERFRQQGISTPVLIISMYVEPELIRRSFEAGANGFMHKEELGEHWLEAIRRINRGEGYLSPRAREALDSEDQGSPNSPSPG